MKNLLTTAILALCVAGATAQELQMDSTTGKWMYRGIVKVDSVGSSELFDRANVWIARSYRSANVAIQYSSKEEGKIVAKGNWLGVFGESSEHVIIIETKDGRLRYTYTDFVSVYTSGQRNPLEKVKAQKTTWRRFAENAQKSGASLAQSVLSASKSSDW